MNYVPGLRKRPKATFRKERSVPQFRNWVKRHHCSVRGCNETFPMDPAHVRCDLPADSLKGGQGLKPHDAWIIPLCRTHHTEQHAGERSFSIKYQIDPVALAETLWKQWLGTDAGRKWELKQRGDQ